MSDEHPQDADSSPDFTPDELNGDTIEVEIPSVTAPTFPIEHVLNNSHTFFQRTIGGGMDLKFVALVATQHGNMPAPDATVVRFNAESWDRFKRECMADGDKPRIQTVRHFPGGLLNGEGQ